MAEAAQCALRETFTQFQINLNAFSRSDDPEVLHQGRVGWRRFKTTLRLFKPITGMKTDAPWLALQSLLTCMGEMRELDVAMHDTLPPLEAAYSGGSAERQKAWQTMTLALAKAQRLQRKAVQLLIEDSATATAIELTSRWIEELTVSNDCGVEKRRINAGLRSWARRRVAHLDQELHTALLHIGTPAGEHHVRILAKRLRYSIELFGPLLAKCCWTVWYQEAIHLQSNLGIGRDLIQASLLIERLDFYSGILEFLRGFDAGKRSRLTCATS